MASISMSDALSDDAPLTCIGEDGEEVEMMPKDLDSTWFSWRTFLLYSGSGWLMSLAYLDPGNLESDLQSGAKTGYSLLWVLLVCTVMGLMLQALAARLGIVTGRNLAQTCRREYSRTTSRTIWVMTEIAIIGADVQEVLGSAIAFRTLFGWPLWVGSLVTGLDTFTFLLIHYLGKRLLEFFIFLLIVFMMVCFFINWFIQMPPIGAMLKGFVPTCPSFAVLQLVGTIGAVIMPHNIYLHSALVQSRGVNRRDQVHVQQANKYMLADSALALALSFFINAALLTSFAGGFFAEECAAGGGDPLACVPGAVCEGPGCTTCRTGQGQLGVCSDIGLEGAGDALQSLFGSRGSMARNVFALGVLAAGQASTMTGTFAGQFVMEGFLEWTVPIWIRTLITRSIALGPAIVVALLTSSTPGLNNTVSEWLNILQAVQLPFALLPVLHFTSDRSIMGDRFVLKRRWRVVCWALAFVVIGTNFYLVSNKLVGSPWWAWSLALVGFGLYLGFISVIIRSDLRQFLALFY